MQQEEKNKTMSFLLRRYTVVFSSWTIIILCAELCCPTPLRLAAFQYSIAFLLQIQFFFSINFHNFAYQSNFRRLVQKSIHFFQFLFFSLLQSDDFCWNTSIIEFVLKYLYFVGYDLGSGRPDTKVKNKVMLWIQ